MKGRPAEPVQAMDTKERIGVDGQEDRLLGKRAPESQIETIKTYADIDTADTEIYTQADMVGTVVILTDSFGAPHRVVVKNSESTVRSIKKPVGTGTSISDTILVKTVWAVRMIVDSYLESES